MTVFNKKGPSSSVLSEALALKILEDLYLTHYLDQKLEKLAKQNKGGTFYLSGGGHELVGAVCAHMLTPKKDWALPYYRDQAFPIALGCDLVGIIAAFLGRVHIDQGSSKMMPYHYSDRKLNIFSQSSPVGTQFLQAVGIALSVKLSKKDEVVYVSAGDGATSQGDFHEALNFSTIHNLPVIFVVQDNEWAISVSSSEQTSGESIKTMVQGYHNLYIEEVDGIDYLGLVRAMSFAVKKARKKKGPSVLVTKVPRLEAHSGSDNQKKYRSESDLKCSIKKDPLTHYQAFLLQQGLATQKEIDNIKKETFLRVEKAVDEAESLPFSDKKSATKDIFKAIDSDIREESTFLENEIVIMDGLNKALKEEMKEDKSILVFGQDVAHEKGGVFGITADLTEEFGVDRCFNTPLAESTIMGIALGLSVTGRHKACAEIQFADYIWTGINHLINEISNLYWRSNGQWSCPLVIRVPYGGYIQGGMYHSQSLEGYLTHCPGIKIVAPSNAEDAKTLLKMAIRDPNPVIFLEHKAIYRQRAYCTRKEPSSDSLALIGKAKVVMEGKDVTIVSWGMTLVKAFQVAKQLEKTEGVSSEVIDLRTLIPLDIETILSSVEKTGKLLIIHEASMTSGFGAEIAARIMERGFQLLDAPVKRLCALDTPVAYSKQLEDAILPQNEDIEKAIIELVDY